MVNLNVKVRAYYPIWYALLLSIGICQFIILINGCTKELDMDLNSPKSLVLNSIMQPDSNFSFRISYTASPLQEYDSLTDSVHLTLYRDNQLIVDTIFFKEYISLPILPFPGYNYTVEIASGDYPSIRVADSIPNLVYVNEALFIFPAGVDGYGDFLAEADITFTDPANETNYYELLIFNSELFPDPGSRSYWFCEYQTNDRVLVNEGDLDYSPNSFFFSDELFNGERYTMKIKRGGYMMNDYSERTDHYVILRSISKSYYMYLKYYTRHSYNQQFQGDFLDLIFKGEPQGMYTNIENGFGIFAGYQEYIMPLTYRKPG